MRGCRRGTSRGFTLLELLVVMVLGALAVAVVGAGTQSLLDRSRFHEAVRGVGALLHAARTQAIRSGERVDVTFDLSTRVLTTPAQQLEIPPTVEIRWAQAVVGRGTSKESKLPIVFTFTPDGSGHGGHFDLLRAGRGVAFRVNWLLGSVEQSEALAQP